jgi:hypothetical protein
LDYAVPAAMNPLPSGVEQESSDWGGAVAADFDEDDRHDSWDGANCSENWRCSANSPPDGDGGNWRFDDFYPADFGGDSAGFYLL